MATVLVVGSGGREYSLADTLARSCSVSLVLCAPGNAGTSRLSHVQNVSVSDHDALVRLCRERHVSMVVVGPEQPLVEGLADKLTEAGVPCFGPSSTCALLEADKAYAKRVMHELNIPTARWREFHDAHSAKQFINDGAFNGDGACVVKAAGLAAGKGVMVCCSAQQACDAVDRWVRSDDGLLSGAGSCLVIEERLHGEEVSLMCFTDGHSVIPLPPAQDYKRLGSGDRGPNTGGMGAVAPSSGPLSHVQLSHVVDRCLRPVVEYLKSRGTPYIGCLYAGLMVARDGASWHVLEYNCRLGDPESQVVLPLLRGDLFSLMEACVCGHLASQDVQWYGGPQEARAVVGVVLASREYPAGPYDHPQVISGLEDGDQLWCDGEVECHVIHAATKLLPDGRLVTAGGRVVTIVARAEHVVQAQQAAVQAATQHVQFTGKQWRQDVGASACARYVLQHSSGSLTYKQAGVDVHEGDRFVAAISERVQQVSSSLWSRAAVESLGHFAGVFDLSCVGPHAPVLVAGTDGVGSKLLLGRQCDRHECLGQDLVAMCVNDVMCAGGRPLFMLDYIATANVQRSSESLRRLMNGMLDACLQAECQLIGGETAEMPDMYGGPQSTMYDVAGFAVGVVSHRKWLLPHRDLMTVGDCVIGLAASGLHSNGFSLVRRLLDRVHLDYRTSRVPWSRLLLDACDDSEEDRCGLTAAAHNSLAEELLTPTTIYWRALRELLPSASNTAVHEQNNTPPLLLAAAHVTGGGLAGNLARVLPSHVSACLDATGWMEAGVTRRAVAPLVWFCSPAAGEGGVSVDELAATFNLGVGMVLVVPRQHVQLVTHKLRQVGEQPLILGQLQSRTNLPTSPAVTVNNINECVVRLMSVFYSSPSPISAISSHHSQCRVAVLVSGSGSNMHALINYSRTRQCYYRVVLVLCNEPGAGAITLAREAAVTVRVVPHGEYASRELFDRAMDVELRQHNIQLVCCAGFMRILSAWFLRTWHGRLLNIHPSLLPAFPGLHPHEQALAAGVCMSGCTVHAIEEGRVDTGRMLAQKAVPVRRNDTAVSLQQRVKLAEHQLYPHVLNQLAEIIARDSSSHSPVDKLIMSQQAECSQQLDDSQ